MKRFKDYLCIASVLYFVFVFFAWDFNVMSDATARLFYTAFFIIVSLMYEAIQAED